MEPFEEDMIWAVLASHLLRQISKIIIIKLLSACMTTEAYSTGWPWNTVAQQRLNDLK